MDYWETLQRTRYALHIHGSQPFSPRLFECIVAGAVPIIIAPGYVLPFEEILDWQRFSLYVEPSQVSNLYDIVAGVNESRYQSLAWHLAQVAEHFRYSAGAAEPQPGDAFYMTMYSTFL